MITLGNTPIRKQTRNVHCLTGGTGHGFADPFVCRTTAERLAGHRQHTDRQHIGPRAGPANHSSLPIIQTPTRGCARHPATSRVNSNVNRAPRRLFHGIYYYPPDAGYGYARWGIGAARVEAFLDEKYRIDDPVYWYLPPAYGP